MQYYHDLELIARHQMQAGFPLFFELLSETSQVAELQKNKHQFAKIKKDIKKTCFYHLDFIMS